MSFAWSPMRNHDASAFAGTDVAARLDVVLGERARRGELRAVDLDLDDLRGCGLRDRGGDDQDEGCELHQLRDRAAGRAWLHKKSAEAAFAHQLLEIADGQLDLAARHVEVTLRLLDRVLPAKIWSSTARYCGEA